MRRAFAAHLLQLDNGEALIVWCCDRKHKCSVPSTLATLPTTSPAPPRQATLGSVVDPHQHQSRGVVAEWSNAQDSKSCSFGSVRSNRAHVDFFFDFL